MNTTQTFSLPEDGKLRYRSGEELIPGYTLVEFLGRGSYGEVWKATGPGGTEVALKFITLDGAQGLKEFKSIGLVKKLRHPNLVPLQAIWLRDTVGNVMSESPVADPNATESTRIRLGGLKELVIAMGLGDLSLAQRAEQKRDTGGIPIQMLLRYMDGAARGIDFLNEPTHPPDNTPIIHCDIKPANLLIVGGDVQVCDYGVARALGSDVRKTQGAGTPAYSPPELLNNDPCPQTDQYSLAITYFEMRTGHLPFDERRALAANMSGDLDLSSLEPNERAVIRRATSLQPSRRYPTVQEMVDELRVACGISLSRSAAIPRPPERRIPSPPPPGTSKAKLTPLPPPAATVTFPERLRPTPVPPPPLATETSSPWADATELVPALSSSHLGSRSQTTSRPKWLWPLLAVLVLGGGGIAAYFATRPDDTKHVSNDIGKQTPPETTTTPKKPPEKENTNTTTTAIEIPTSIPAPRPVDLLAKIRASRFATADEAEDAAQRIETMLKAASDSEVESLRDTIRGIVTPKLTEAEQSFAWVAKVRVSDFPLKADKDATAAWWWFVAASRITELLSDTTNSKHLTTLRTYAQVVQGVAATKPVPPDSLGWYEAALTHAKKEGMPGQLRYEFVYKPLMSDSLRDVSKARQSDAVTFLVRMATDLTTGTFGGEVPSIEDRKADASQLIVRAYRIAPRDTLAILKEKPHRGTLPCDDLAEILAKEGESAANEASKDYRNNPDAAKKKADTATQFYKDAVALAPEHPLLANWHRQLGRLIATYHASDVKDAKRSENAADAISHSLEAYLLAAKRAASGKSISKDDRLILEESVGMQKKEQYQGLGKVFRDQKNEARCWDALAAECDYMQSEMTASDRAALEKARDAISPNTDNPGLRDSRNRMERLLKLKPRSELLK